MDKKLLSILCCPVTHRPLSVAKSDLLARVNAAIAQGDVSNREGTVIGDPLSDALVTDDGKLLYPIDNGIPVLLEGESISTEQLAHG